MDMPILGFVPIARPTFDVPYAEELTSEIYGSLEDAGYQLVGSSDLIMSMDAVEDTISALADETFDLLFVLQSTFADSTMVLRLSEAIDAPILMWALPEPRVGGRLRLNSFCGINLAGHGLTRVNVPYEYIYAEPNDTKAMQKLFTVAKAASAKRQLQSANIGRVGEHPAGFDTCRFDANDLAETFGINVVQVELNAVFEQAKQADPEQVAVVRERVQAQVAGLDEMDATATDGTLSTYLTLENLAQENDLHGVAVRCWPEFFTDLGCSACGAMSMMTNSMKPSSCEADVNGTLTQYILQLLSGEPSFGTDVVSFDVDEDVAVLWHCGLAPISMADPDFQPQATIHSNREMPLLMEFPLKAGRVTVARISESTGQYRLVIGAGEMIKAPPSFTGTTGTLRFDNGAQAVMDAIMDEGLEHHVSITYGDHVNELKALAKMLKIDVLEI